MPTISGIDLGLNAGKTMRLEGITGWADLRPEIAATMDDLLADVDPLDLVAPAIAYEIYNIVEMDHDRVLLEGGGVLICPLIPSVMPEAEELAVAVCTIGDRLERRAAGYFHNDQPLLGLLLDGIGTAALESLVGEACLLIQNVVSPLGLRTSSPVNPGMPGFPLAVQRQIVGMVPAAEIGVSLTNAGIMVPQKSISMVVGIGHTSWMPTETCAHCNLRGECRYQPPC